MDPQTIADDPKHDWSCEHEVFADDGYPTEEYLEHIRLMDGVMIFEDPWRFVDVIKEGWAYPDYIWEQGKYLYISTGGWSGNEDIIDALHHSMFWWVFFFNHRRGGHYTFEMRHERRK